MPTENKLVKFLYNQFTFGIAICSVVMSCFIYLTDPWKDADTAIKLQDQRVNTQQITIDKLTETQQNDIKEMKNEVAGLRTEIQVLTNNITALTTIIDERIPKK